MESDNKLAELAAFIYGLIHLIAATARSIVLTRQDIREKYSRMKKHYAVHGLKIAFVRLGAMIVTLAITVRFADLTLFWGILLAVYVVSFIGTCWLMFKRLPKDLPDRPQEQTNQEFEVKWWGFAIQFIFLTLWVYSWRHLYS